jgi:phosphoribosylanthranilate isomerase
VSKAIADAGSVLGVDVSSGVEEEKGKGKDENRVRGFIHAAKA